jgi:hypothetical protein
VSRGANSPYAVFAHENGGVRVLERRLPQAPRLMWTPCLLSCLALEINM